MRRLLAILVSLAVAGCASTETAAPASDLPGVHAAQVQAPYLLTFDLPRDTWSANEAITGTATLALVQGDAADLGGAAGGLFGFEFETSDGRHHVEPISDAACATYRLAAGTPMQSRIVKSGGYYPEQPDFEFNRAFLADEAVRLPAGDWKITAIASFAEGKWCAGGPRTIRATITVHITP